MELRHIKDLMAAMGKTGTKRLKLKMDNVELELERQAPHAAGIEEGAQPVVAHALPAAPGPDPKAALSTGVRAPEAHRASKAPETAEEVNGASLFVTSPMVGVFYHTPSPDDPPFVKVGQRVSADTVVCIVEAMKVMNEVKAGVEGTVAEMLLERGHPVEFGSKLFRIIPD